MPEDAEPVLDAWPRAFKDEDLTFIKDWNPTQYFQEKPHWAQLGRATGEDGTWFVERTWPTPTADAGKIPVRPFIGPAVYVRCQYGLTLNLGRYESARIDVSLSVPCYPAEVQETYEFVSKWVSERVLQERAEIDAYREQATTQPTTVSNLG